MIEVRIGRGEGDHIREFRVSGHAGFDEAGKDIVCAAVSVLAQTAILGLEEHVGLNLDVEVNSGMLRCRLPEIEDYITRLRADAILESMVLGLQGIADEYEENIKVVVERNG